MDYKKLYPAQWEEFQKRCEKNKAEMMIKDPKFKEEYESIEREMNAISYVD